jgi:release factor glutamine methyltransferase
MSEARPAPSPAAPWTVLGLLRWTTEHFASRGLASPRLDAECLLAHALGTDRLRLYLDFDKPVGALERGRFRELVRRRAAERVPVAQLTGAREFWSLPLEVTRDVLVPRPETETLVEAALALAGERGPELRVLDVGTGSGAVALALAKELPAAQLTATDVSPEALAVAARNAERLALGDRVRFACGPLYAPVAGERFDLVVSNPPYLAEAEAASLAPELGFEPRAALFAGPRGDEVLVARVEGAGAVLAPGGGFALEIAPDQAGGIRALCAERGLEEVRVVQDLAGRARVVAARAPGQGGA